MAQRAGLGDLDLGVRSAFRAAVSVPMTPSSSFVTKSRSRMRIVPLFTSSPIAGAIRPVNLLPGNPMM
jgi:hypothetical protein